MEPVPATKKLAAAKKSGPGHSWCCKLNCCIVNCSNCTISCPKLWFFKLPSNKRREEWLKYIDQPEMQAHNRLVVCETHFASTDLHGRGTPRSRARFLKHDAVPTLLLPPINRYPICNKTKKVYQRTSKSETKGSTQINNKDGISIENEKLNGVKEENNDSVSSDNEELCDYNKINNQTLNNITKLFLKLKDISESDSKVYSNQFKSNIFQLYHENSQTYEVLQSTLGLPPVSTLPSFVPLIPSEINKIYIKDLKAEISHMSLSDKYGVLCVNIMGIKPYVNYDYESDTLCGVSKDSSVELIQYALIAVVRGLNTKWHHIASIALVGLQMFAEFNTWLDRLIKTITEIGISLKAVVTGTDDFFINSFELREEYNINRMFIINKKKIYHIFDPLHLMLLLYDELQKYKISFNKTQRSKKKTIAKWSDISNFFTHDKTRKFRLTDRSIFIDPNVSHQKKLQSAAQILSLQTAAGISTFVDLKILDKTVMGTVDFIVIINSIFAALYPETCQSETQKLQAQSDNFLKNKIGFINSIKCIPRKHETEEKPKVKFINCFNTSIENLLRLQEELYLKEHPHLLSQYLNIDPLTELIDNISSKSVKSKFLTVNEFLEVIRDNLMRSFPAAPPSDKEEKYIGINAFMEKAITVVKQNCFEETKDKTSRTSFKRCIENESDDYTEFDDEDANSIFYVATYLLDKMYQKYTTAVSMRMRFMNSSVYFENRNESIFGSIIIPDNDFLQFVYNMDTVFVNGCQKVIASGRVFEGLKKEINKFIVPGPIDTGLEYLISLFIDLRLYHTIKHNNCVFEENKTKIHQFLTYRLNSYGVNLKKAKFTLNF